MIACFVSKQNEREEINKEQVEKSRSLKISSQVSSAKKSQNSLAIYYFFG